MTENNLKYFITVFFLDIIPNEIHIILKCGLLSIKQLN